MELKSLLFFTVSLFILNINAFAEISEVEVNGAVLKLTKLKYRKASLVEASLAVSQDIKFGKNFMRSVPEGTEIKILKNKEGQDYIHFMIVSGSMPKQKWLAFEGVELILECGAQKNKGFRFISFYENNQMDTGCQSAVDQPVPVKTKDRIEILAESDVSLFPNGHLKYSSKARGEVVIEGQLLHLKNGKDIAYFSGEQIRFFNLEKGVSFSFEGAGLEKARFGQSVNGAQVATVFYENGMLDQTYLLSSLNTQSIKVLHQNVEIKLSEGPVGFSEEGGLDRVVLSEAINIDVVSEVKIYLEDRQNQDAFEVNLKPGDPFTVAPGTPLFLTKKGDVLTLKSFPVQIGGQVYLLTILGL